MFASDVAGDLHFKFKRTISEAARFFALGRPPLWTIGVIPAAIVGGAVLGVVPPLLIGRIVNALDHHNTAATLHQFLIYVVVMLLSGLLGLIESYSSSRFREVLARNLQLQLSGIINRARFDKLAELTLGQVANRITGDVRSLGSQLEYSLFPTITNICALVATIIAMIRLDYRLAIVAFLFSFVVLLPLSIARPYIAALQKRVASATDEFYGAIMEDTSLSALVAYRNASASRRKVHRLEQLTERILKMRVSTVLVGAGTGMASAMINMIGPAAVMGLGAYFVVHGQLSVGSLITVLIYQSRMSRPIGALSQLQVTASLMGVTIGRLMEISNLPQEDGGALEFIPGDITISNVALKRGEHKILFDVSLAIGRGRHVAIIGPSGAGKSSLAALLIRLYDASSGTIRIGDHAIWDFSLDALRSAVCLVSQDPFILDSSALENLTLSQPTLEPGALSQAIAIARLEGVIHRLPSGLETHLGQRGFRLSGGERQRICLARGLLQNPQVLILDEALTGVDIAMERQILTDVRAAFSTRTLIVITHRIDSVKDFDVLVALDAGTIVAQGSPQDFFQDERWSRMTATWSNNSPVGSPA